MLFQSMRLLVAEKGALSLIPRSVKTWTKKERIEDEKNEGPRREAKT
jgi:hypothetical protein